MEPCKGYVSYTTSGSDVNIACGQGTRGTHHVRLRFCRAGMVEVSFSPLGEIADTAFKNYDIWLKMNWPPVSVEVVDMNQYIMARTSELTVRVMKGPALRLEYYRPDNLTYIAGDASVADGDGVYGMGSAGTSNARDSLQFILRKKISATDHFFGFGDGNRHWEEYKFDRRGQQTSSTDQNGGPALAPFFYSTDGYGLFVNHSPNIYDDVWGNSNHIYFDMGKTDQGNYTAKFSHRGGMGRTFMTYYFIYGPGWAKVMDGFTEGAGVPEPAANAKTPIWSKWIYGAYYNATQWRTIGELEGHVYGMRNGGFPYDCEVGDNLVCWKTNADGFHFFPNAGDAAYADAVHKNPTDLIKFLDTMGVKYGRNIDIQGRGMTNPGGDGWKPIASATLPPQLVTNAQYYVDHGFDIMWADNERAQGAPETVHHRFTRESFLAWKAAHGGDASKALMIVGWSTWCAQAFATISFPGDFYGNTAGDLAASMVGLMGQHDGSKDFRALSVSAQCRFHESYFGGVFPYKEDAGTKAAYSKWIGFRYRLIPYLFTCGGIAHETGVPAMRHMFMGDEQNPLTWDKADAGTYLQYYLGDWLLTAPPNSEYDNPSVWFPKGTWYDWFNGSRHEYNTTLSNINCGDQSSPTSTVPLYAKAGAIVPLMPPMQWVGQIPEDPITLRVWPSGSSSFTLFEDETPVKTTFRCDASTGQDLVSIPSFGGSKYSPATRKYRLEVYTADRKPQKVARDNANTLLTELTTKTAYDAASSGWFYDAANHGTCYVKPAGDARNGFSVIVSYNGTVAVSSRMAVDLGLIRIQRNAAGNAVTVSVPCAGAHTIKLLNARGQVIELLRGSQPQIYSIPLGRASDGMYLLRLSLPDGQTMVKRLMGAK